MKRILLQSMGSAVLLAGTTMLAWALSVLVGYANDTFEELPFPWSLLGLAAAGLSGAVGGAMVVLRAGTKTSKSGSLNIRAGS